MSFTVIALGNPSEEFDSTRHNAGRVVLEPIVKSHGATFGLKEKYKSLVSEIVLDYDDIPSEMQHHAKKSAQAKCVCVMPETYMNNSGQAAQFFTNGVKAPKQLIVIHDDLDLPLGGVKVSYDRGAGGHKGVLSIVRTIKTQQFLRIRVGISPVTPKGVVKKPIGADAVERHILGTFKPTELTVLKKVSKKVQGILATYMMVDRQEATMFGNNS
jgi:peptidyl-tRNA hydrolase, PTH1 family